MGKAAPHQLAARELMEGIEKFWLFQYDECLSFPNTQNIRS